MSFQVIQRNTATTGNIPIAGILPGGPYDVEARFNGGSWTTIASGVSGQFTATLSTQPVGNGLLEVRRVGSALTSTAANVGIGEIFIIAGQSNASGFADNNQAYTGGAPGRLFGNDYLWKGIYDPTDDPLNQVDTVSKDVPGQGAKGSIWPRLGSGLADLLGVPIAFVPTALGGTLISSWLPGADHFDRATLYGSMAHRAQVAGCRAVLWWQGESDAFSATPGATYNSRLDTVANTINADLGVKLMACKLQICPGVLPVFEAAINTAIGDAWGDNANVLTGPDLSDITAEDDFHIRTDGLVQTVADRWKAALVAEAANEGWGW